jgi:hypothetical protein
VKIAVVGSRTYPNLAEVRQFVWEQDRNTVIVSGGASGVDSAAIHEARRLGMEYEVHLPDWNVHGRSAGRQCHRPASRGRSDRGLHGDCRFLTRGSQRR